MAAFIRSRALWIGAGIALAALLVAALIWSFLADAGKPRKPTPQQIALLRPPPPPPPPKPEQKPPEPPVKREEVKIPPPPSAPEPQAANNEPAGKDLGVDAEGAAGSDAFGLAARKGGRDLLAGSPGGAARNSFAFYTSAVQKFLQDELARDRGLGGRSYRVSVTLWIDRAGRIERFVLAESSGNGETDKLIRAAFDALPPFRVPPEDLPRPIGLRIQSRGTS
jgi:protein TonB